MYLLLIYLSICGLWFVCLFVCSSVCLSVCLFVCLFACLPACLLACLVIVFHSSSIYWLKESCCCIAFVQEGKLDWMEYLHQLEDVLGAVLKEMPEAC